MPPKAKFTRKAIVDAALTLVREQGIGALTARTLGERLNSSARPIFTVFQNMEAVRHATVDAAKSIYATYVRQGLQQTDMPAFKGVGMAYLHFAEEEPELFRLLFMTGWQDAPPVGQILPQIEEHYPQILASIIEGYGLSHVDAEGLYRHLWIYTHGIAVLCVTGLCHFSHAEMGQMLTQVCRAILQDYQEGTI